MEDSKHSGAVVSYHRCNITIMSYITCPGPSWGSHLARIRALCLGDPADEVGSVPPRLNFQSSLAAIPIRREAFQRLCGIGSSNSWLSDEVTPYNIMVVISWSPDTVQIIFIDDKWIHGSHAGQLSEQGKSSLLWSVTKPLQQFAFLIRKGSLDSTPFCMNP